MFHVTKAGTFDEGLSTLQLRGNPDAERLSSVVERLQHVRSHRFKPSRDDKVVASWNGWAVDSLVQAAMVFGEPGWLDLARSISEALWQHNMVDGHLRRVSLAGVAGPDEGALDDYAAVALGWARLGAAIGEAVWVQRAEGLLAIALADFAAGDGGFYDTSARAEALLVRPRSLTDNPTPSGTSTLVAALRLVGLLADRDDLLGAAGAALGTLRPYTTAVPRFAGWALAEELISDEARKGLGQAVCVVVEPASEGISDLARAAFRMAPAGTAVIVGPPGTTGFAHHFEERDAEVVSGYVCRGTTCFAPATDVEGVRTALWSRC